MAVQKNFKRSVASDESSKLGDSLRASSGAVFCEISEFSARTQFTALL